MFDPNIPATNAEATSAMFRGQFQGLKALIDAVSGVTGAVVDSVTTLPSGSQATVNVSVAGTVLHLSFGIPAGTQGQAGQNGQGGAQGPPFANAVVDAVNTLNPGEPATVEVSFDGTNVHFTIGIPQGAMGATGDQGPGGEISQVDLSNAITDVLVQTSGNSNGVSTLGLAVSDPPSQGELQAVADKLDELITALRRP
jgi:hypothetical protein